MEASEDFKKLHEQFEKLRAHYSQLGALKTRREKMESETWQAVKRVVADAKKVLGDSAGAASLNSSQENAAPPKQDNLEKVCAVPEASTQAELEQIRLVVEASKQRDELHQKELEKLHAAAEAREADFVKLQGDVALARAAEMQTSNGPDFSRLTPALHHGVDQTQELMALRAENRLQKKQIEALKADLALKEQMIERHKSVGADKSGSTGDCSPFAPSMHNVLPPSFSSCPTSLTASTPPFSEAVSPYLPPAVSPCSPATKISVQETIPSDSVESANIMQGTTNQALSTASQQVDPSNQFAASTRNIPTTLQVVKEDSLLKPAPPWKQLREVLHAVDTPSTVPSQRAESSTCWHVRTRMEPSSEGNASWTSETPQTSEMFDGAFTASMQSWDHSGQGGLGLCRSAPSLTRSVRSMGGAQGTGPVPQKTVAVNSQSPLQLQSSHVLLKPLPSEVAKPVVQPLQQVRHTPTHTQMQACPAIPLQQQQFLKAQRMHQSPSPPRLSLGPPSFIFNASAAGGWRSRSTSPIQKVAHAPTFGRPPTPGSIATQEPSSQVGNLCSVPAMPQLEGVCDKPAGTAVIRVGEGVYMNVDE